MLLIGTSSFYNSFEKTRAQYARGNLITIYNAQKRYRLNEGVYFPAQLRDDGGIFSPWGSFTVTQSHTGPTPINNGLGINIRDPYFNYSITVVPDVVPHPDTTPTYTATATRLSGPCKNIRMQINESTTNVTIIGNCYLW